MPSFSEFTKPNYSIWLNGPAGSGKTRAALGFPKVFAITFDPTGLDIAFEPDNAALRANVVWHCPLNGLALSTIFQVTEQPSEDSLYGALALARKLATEGKIETVLIDGFTYLATLKWDHICQDEQIETKKGGLDTQKMYGRLSVYLNQFVLQNLMPLATRSNLNVIVTCHVQRESKQAVEGITNPSDPGFDRTKRQVNLESDLNPQVIGGFRQTVEGLPSALIYLDHKVEVATDADVKAGRAKQAGDEILNYYAYCRKTFVRSLDSQVNAKNRYGLPAILKLTNANFYKTLISKLSANGSTTATRAEAQPTAKGANK
jgi:hypothetical protein